MEDEVTVRNNQKSKNVEALNIAGTSTWSEDEDDEAPSFETYNSQPSSEISIDKSLTESDVQQDSDCSSPGIREISAVNNSEIRQAFNDANYSICDESGSKRSLSKQKKKNRRKTASLKRKRESITEDSSEESELDSKEDIDVLQMNIEECVVNEEAIKRSWKIMTDHITKMKRKIKMLQQRNRRLQQRALLYKNILLYYKEKYLIPKNINLNLSDSEPELESIP